MRGIAVFDGEDDGVIDGGNDGDNWLSEDDGILSDIFIDGFEYLFGDIYFVLML